VLGALCTGKKSGNTFVPKLGLDVSIGYRYQPSSRHFIGTVEQKQRELVHNQIQNNYHLTDLAVNYQINRRWSVNTSLPILVATRNQLYTPRGRYDVAGIGDMTFGTKAWLLRGAENGNIQLGISLKAPTGDPAAKSIALGRFGHPILAVADQSIQAGDGGWGFALDSQGYRRFFWDTTLYYSGSYLFNPENTNGVPTFRTRKYEDVMSVTDQYLYRAGISRPVPGKLLRGLSVSFGGRIEGVPVRDAFGKSDGFRRPGYAISVDPGFMYSRSAYILAVNVPWAVERNRRRSVPDIKNGTHGDAAFADYALTIGFTRRF
jgi:hypothetical protein